MEQFMCFLLFGGKMNINVFKINIVNMGIRRLVMKNKVCFFKFRLNIMMEQYDRVLDLVFVDNNFQVLFLVKYVKLIIEINGYIMIIWVGQF